MSRIVFTSSKIQITTQTNNQNEKKSQLFSSKILCVVFISQDQSSLQCFKPSHFEFILFFSVTAPWVCHTNYHIRISISLLPIERTHTHVVRKCFVNFRCSQKRGRMSRNKTTDAWHSEITLALLWPMKTHRLSCTDIQSAKTVPKFVCIIPVETDNLMRFYAI